MKKVAILLSLIVGVCAQTTIDSLKASKVNRSILEVSQSTLDTLQSHGMKLYINQYYNLSDWDNDGLKDLVITVGQEETINTYASLFKQKKVNSTVKFVEDPSYLMNIQGRPHDWSTSVGDVNGDNLLDIVFATENYHGPDGQQPYYFEERKLWTTDKLFINNGNGFNRFELDTTKHNRNGIQEYWHHSGVTLLDWDGDGKLEILLSSGGAKNNGYEPIRKGPNPVFDKLFSSYEVDANNNITLEYAFDWNLENDWIVTYTQKISIINDKLYLAVGEDKGWDTVNSIFVDEALIDGQQFIWHGDSEVLIFDYKQSFGEKSLEKRITLDSKHRGGGMVYQNGFNPADIDNDGKLEYITANWYESPLKQVPFIKIYDDDGTDITDTWLGDKYMDTSKKHGGSGVNVVDINNDGYIDIIPRDGWNYFRDSHSPNMGDFTDETRGTFGIFLNDGTKFNQYNIDFSHLDIDDKSVTYLRSGSRLYTKEPVDFDNDGLYEFLIRFDRGDGNANIDIVTVDYKNNIEDLSDISIKEDSIKVIKLSAADLKGDAISYSAKSSEDNVSAVISNDTLTLTPALNWHGDAQVTAYASGSSWKWKDSTTFTLTVTPVSDSPKPFFWNTVKSDSIAITKDNLNSTYDLDWTESVDVDGDTINYIVYAKIGEYRSEEIFDTTATNYFIPYQEIAEGAFEGLPGNTATIYFSVWAHDGTDSVKISRDDRVLYVNRYDYLSIESEGIPDEFALHDNYPNPFNPTTQIRFDLPEMSNATLTIYNMIGQKIRTFNMKSAPAGYHSLTWNATNDLGAPVSAGVYLYQLQTKGIVKTKKMILLK